MRESQRRIFSGLILLLWHFAVSCRPVEYSIVVVNNTPGMVSDAEVSYGSFQHIGGWIGPGARKTHGGVTEPLARQASVTWRTPTVCSISAWCPFHKWTGISPARSSS